MLSSANDSCLFQRSAILTSYRTTMAQTSDSEDSFELQRFVTAQERFYPVAREELRIGRKRSNWIWFIFPQVDGLGFSSMAQRYAIGSREETAAYVAHPLLGTRLIECTELVLRHQNRSANAIFGSPDDLKFRSSMTLFNTVRRDGIYQKAIDQFYEGRPDYTTLTILQNWDAPRLPAGPRVGKPMES